MVDDSDIKILSLPSIWPFFYPEHQHVNMNQSQVVKNQLDRVLINYSSHKQKEKRNTGAAGISTANKNENGKSEVAQSAKSSYIAYEEYRKSMGMACNLISKK